MQQKKGEQRSPFAERPGFEPGIPFRGIHAFQACLLSHSSISPLQFGCKIIEILRITHILRLILKFFNIMILRLDRIA